MRRQSYYEDIEDNRPLFGKLLGFLFGKKREKQSDEPIDADEAQRRLNIINERRFRAKSENVETAKRQIYAALHSNIKDGIGNVKLERIRIWRKLNKAEEETVTKYFQSRGYEVSAHFVFIKNK